MGLVLRSHSGSALPTVMPDSPITDLDRMSLTHSITLPWPEQGETAISFRHPIPYLMQTGSHGMAVPPVPPVILVPGI